ncbi:MAG: hypothetical protein FLDDKLPJ_02008 [Phycisphaerae bacterium]|nr:hypothetical protein [Phycisphaerae bacterium]
MSISVILPEKTASILVGGRQTVCAACRTAESAHRRFIRTARGFSLVELVIVVVILGIIAAIAARRIGTSAAQAGESSLTTSLSRLRKAIDLYSAEHGGAFPGSTADGLGNSANSSAAFVSHLTLYSKLTGEASATRDPEHIFGPYLRAIPPVPVGPNKGDNEVAIDTSNARPLVTGGTEGWVYNPLTGEIIANTDAANLANTRAYDEY